MFASVLFILCLIYTTHCTAISHERIASGLHPRQSFSGTGIFGPFALITVSSIPGYNNLPIIGTRTNTRVFLSTPGKNPVIPPPKSTFYAFYLNTTRGGYFPDPPLDPALPHLGAYGTIEYPILETFDITAKLSPETNTDRGVLYFSYGEGPSWWEFDEKHRLGFNGLFDRWWICSDVSTEEGVKSGVVWNDSEGDAVGLAYRRCGKVEIRKSEWDR